MVSTDPSIGFCVKNASDHLPIFADFKFGVPTSPTNVFQSENIPTTFELKQNYPSPFNPETVITLSVFSYVQLKVFDLLGKEVATLVSEEKHPGIYKVKLMGTNLPSGIYFYRLQSGSFSKTKKLALIK